MRNIKRRFKFFIFLCVSASRYFIFDAEPRRRRVFRGHSCVGTLLSGMFFRKRLKLLIFSRKTLLVKRCNLKNKNNRKICHLRMPVSEIQWHWVLQSHWIPDKSIREWRNYYSGQTELLFQTDGIIIPDSSVRRQESSVWCCATASKSLGSCLRRSDGFNVLTTLIFSVLILSLCLCVSASRYFIFDAEPQRRSVFISHSCVGRNPVADVVLLLQSHWAPAFAGATGLMF